MKKMYIFLKVYNCNEWEKFPLGNLKAFLAKIKIRNSHLITHVTL